MVHHNKQTMPYKISTDRNSQDWLLFTEIIMAIKSRFNPEKEFVIYDKNNTKQVNDIDDIRNMHASSDESDVVHLNAVIREDISDEKASLSIASGIMQGMNYLVGTQNYSKNVGVIKSGWVKKKGHKQISPWNKRFFKLTSDKKLCYFRDETMKQEGEIISLDGVTTSDIEKSTLPKNKSNFGFVAFLISLTN